MTKNEALKAAIDGKRVRCEAWMELIFSWDGEKFITQDNRQAYPHKDPDSRWNSKWEIVPEYVSFTEAWKAFENGKIVQSTQTGNKKKKSDNILQKFDEHEIRGQWLILEDK